MSRFESWGRYPKVIQDEVALNWGNEFPVKSLSKAMLPVGLGRSYGDVCLNDGNIVLLTRGLNRFLSFDPATGVLRCEAGVSLAEILEFSVPRGWFLPVTPGTKYVTVGGAIANDVHGKNHHVAGTFGRFVRGFELVRSDGTRAFCSPESNPDGFAATIGGLGLTGLITWAEIQLRPVSGRSISIESVKFRGLNEFVVLSKELSDHEYTVAWVDCVSSGKEFARGIFLAGDHSSQKSLSARKSKRSLTFPCDLPSIALNRYSVAAFNAAYYRKQFHKHVSTASDYEPFFYPLDAILRWNRLYGKRGLTQFQCCVPSAEAISEILAVIAKSGLASFLAVLKVCGNLKSPGMMSFPMPGITLALDFPMKAGRTEPLLERLNQMTADAGGRVYPAKDAFMTAKQFRRFYPQWEEFARFVDPSFSSSFWRRVMNR